MAKGGAGCLACGLAPDVSGAGIGFVKRSSLITVDSSCSRGEIAELTLKESRGLLLTKESWKVFNPANSVYRLLTDLLVASNVSTFATIP